MNRNKVVIVLCVVFSIVTGIFAKDLVVGGTILATGLLCAYFASVGKRSNYLYGFVNYLFMGYVSFKNHLYGIFFAYLFLFAPLQIHGYIKWNKNLDEEENVIARGFTFKNSILIIGSCLVGSLFVGFLLTLIPGQRLAYLDATSNCINLCGVLLLNLRFKEAWWLWLVNNIIDLSIWVITTMNHGEGAVMMLLVSIGYLLINIYGIVKWNKEMEKGEK